MRIRPLNIRFAHDSVSHKFSCGRRLDDTLDELWYGRIRVTDILQMIVVRVGDLWFAYTGNRRLWVFHNLEELGRLHTIDVQVTPEGIPRRRLTTKNMGISVRVRGFLRLVPQPDAYSSSYTSTAESRKATFCVRACPIIERSSLSWILLIRRVTLTVLH